VLFLTTLKEILGEKLLTCTIEAKLPGANPETSTSDAAFYTSLNTICDEVRVMAYDMRFSDMAFAVIQQAPYIPSADVRTVKKSIDYISTYIAPSKLVLGVALYGYEYEVTETSTSTSYKLLWSFSPSYIPQLLSKVHGSIVRGESGEAYITYTTDAQGKPSPSFRETAPFVAATSSGKNSTYRVAWWSDNTAVEKKTELAKMMGLKGVSLFRLDGDTEEGLWELLK
jgi:spore germination protein YaaH